MSVDYVSTRDAVKQEAITIRKRHGALDWGASIDDLIAGEGLSQGKFSLSSPLPAGIGGIREALERTPKKVKALLSVKEQVILLAHELPQTKSPFAKGHELGHSSLRWHREILYVCDEHDLSRQTREQMEWEANLFSAEVLLPEPLVDQVCGTYDISMQTVLLLHEWSGASIESSAIRFVERHPKECALLVLDDTLGPDDKPGLTLTRKILSKNAVGTLGALTRRQFFNSNHNLFAASRDIGTGSTELVVRNERFAVSILNNSYRVLALVSRS